MFNSVYSIMFYTNQGFKFKWAVLALATTLGFESLMRTSGVP